MARALWGDPEVTAIIGGPFTPQQVEERLGKEIACMRDFQVQYWPIFFFENDQFAGCADLRPYKIEERCMNWDFICGASFGAAASPRRLAGRLLQSRVKGFVCGTSSGECGVAAGAGQARVSVHARGIIPGSGVAASVILVEAVETKWRKSRRSPQKRRGPALHQPPVISAIMSAISAVRFSCGA